MNWKFAITTVCMSGIVFFTSATAFASARTVTAPNYEFRFNTADTYASGDRVSYYNQLGAAATFPLGYYFGAALNGGYTTTTLLPTPATTSLNAQYPWGACSYHSNDLGADLFARLFEKARIGLAYTYNRLNSHCQASFLGSNTNQLESNTYSTSGEYYFNRVTLAAAWFHTRIQHNNVETSDSFSLDWYPTDLSRIAIVSRTGSLKDTFSLDFEYQPDFLSNTFGLVLDYTSQHQIIASQTIMLGFRYYFDTNVDLLQRDRYYR